MTPATQILLFGKPFRIADYFRMGQIGWHWQFDDPNTLYRRRNWLNYSRNLQGWNTGNLTRTENAATAPDGTLATQFAATASVATLLNSTTIPSVVATATVARFFVTIKKAAGSAIGYTIIRNSTTGSNGDILTLNYDTGAVTGAGSSTAGTMISLGSGWYLLVVVRTAGVSPGDLMLPYLGWIGGTATAGDAIYACKTQLDFGDTATSQSAVEAAYQPVPTTWAQAYLDAVGAERIYAWTDTAGTTPVTAIGDGIGLLLGREYGGARGPERVSNGGFAANVTGWVHDGSGSLAWSASDGGSAVVTTGGVTYTGIVQTITGLVVGKTYVASCRVKAGTYTGQIAIGMDGIGWGTLRTNPTSFIDSRMVFVATGTSIAVKVTQYNNASTGETFIVDDITVREIPGTHLTQATGTAKPTLSARVNLLLSTATMSTQNVTTVATSYKLSFTGTGTVTLSGTSTAGPLVGTGANDRVSLTFTSTAGTLTLTVSGSVTLADLRTADDAAKNIPAYQRVGATAADHDTDGFPHYAEGDGTDNCWASVSTVDGSATDKLSMVTAFTKNSDAAQAALIEHGTSPVNAAEWGASSPGGAGLATVAWTGRSSAGSAALSGENPSGFAAPFTGVVANAVDWAAAAGAEVLLWVNGVRATAYVNGTQENVGFFGNKTLHVLSRAGTSFHVNGRFYGSTGRFGPMSDSERNNLTRWWQKRIGTA